MCAASSTDESWSNRRGTGRRMAGRAVAACAAAVALGMLPGTADASTALLLGGKGKYKELSDQQMAEAFGGYFAGYDKRVNVPFPGTDDLYGSVQVGADNLYAAVYSTAGFKTIGGVSEGAPAVMEVLRRLEADAADPEDGKVPPPKSEMNVAIYGAPSKQLLGRLADLPVPVTPYDIIIVRAEYDGIADFPDNAWNGLAVVNALMGAAQLHVQQSNFDIRNLPTEYTIDTNGAGGTTTTILIPTAVLPILGPLVVLHFDPKLVAGLDKTLRPIVDSAYDRPPMSTGIPPTLLDAPATPTNTTGATAAATTVHEGLDDTATPARPTLFKRATVTARQSALSLESKKVVARHGSSTSGSEIGIDGAGRGSQSLGRHRVKLDSTSTKGATGDTTAKVSRGRHRIVRAYGHPTAASAATGTDG